MMLRYYRVFNIAQTDGVDYTAPEPREVEPIDAAESIIERYLGDDGPALTRGGDEAGYSPGIDTVIVPVAEQFDSDDAYYSTIFHELTHSTGHAKRLDREIANTFGTPGYAREELVAELGSAYLSRVAGLDPSGVEQSAAYLNGWIAALNADPRLIVSAAGQSQRAADLIQGVTWEN